MALRAPFPNTARCANPGRYIMYAGDDKRYYSDPSADRPILQRGGVGMCEECREGSRVDGSRDTGSESAKVDTVRGEWV